LRSVPNLLSCDFFTFRIFYYVTNSAAGFMTFFAFAADAVDADINGNGDDLLFFSVMVLPLILLVT
jgi:hypothetical protein